MTAEMTKFPNRLRGISKRQFLGLFLVEYRILYYRKDPAVEFGYFTYLSQALQSLCIKTQTEYYRRNRDTKYNTMGALYWQFNDIWQAPTWSGIEFSGRYHMRILCLFSRERLKMLHYHVRKFFSQILISSTIKNDRYQAFVLNDYNSLIQTISAELLIYTYQSTLVASYTTQGISLSPLKSIKVFDLAMKDVLCPKNIGIAF